MDQDNLQRIRYELDRDTTLARYYFDVDDATPIRDGIGMDLPDLAQARREAFGIAARFAADPVFLERRGAVVVTVRDDMDTAIVRVRLVCQLETP